MKKFLFLLAAVVALVCTSCGPKHEKDFSLVEKSITADKAYFAENFDSAKFYVTDIYLDEYIKDAKCVDWCQNIFQVGDTVYFSKHYANGKHVIENIYGHWMECIDMADSVKLTFEEAYNILLNSEYECPETNIAVLRRPLYPPFDKYIYIFGSHGTSFIGVNANTGEFELNF